MILLTDWICPHWGFVLLVYSIYFGLSNSLVMFKKAISLYHDTINLLENMRERGRLL
jgi:hypothetical protein